MSTTLRFEALFAELCGLSAEDMQLPLPLLVNLHRAELRAPLHGLAVYAQRAKLRIPLDARKLQQRLAKKYRLDSAILAEDHTVRDVYHLCQEDVAWDDDGEVNELPEVEQALLNTMDQDWLSSDPVAWCFFLACKRVPQAFIPELLEAELNVQPAAHRLVLDMAKLGAAAQVG